jgi:hypothetical protein
MSRFAIHGSLTAKGKGSSMRFSIAASLLAASWMPLTAQSPAPADSQPTATAPVGPPQIHDTNIGFSYSLPADWETLASQMVQPDVPYPAAMGARKGNACAQVELTARHGKPASVVVVTALPFDCYGQSLTDKNLADFATGAAEGLKQTFDITNPVMANYLLGSHKMWGERATGMVKGQPGSTYTLEIACTVLDKGAVCWLTMAADASSLQAFEEQPVTLDGDTFDAIVPASVIPAAPAAAQKKP